MSDWFPFLPEEAKTPFDILSEKEELEVLREGIDSLPELHRAVIRHRFFENLTIEKTSNVVGCSDFKVTGIQSSGLKMLRKHIIDTYRCRECETAVVSGVDWWFSRIIARDEGRRIERKSTAKQKPCATVSVAEQSHASEPAQELIYEWLRWSIYSTRLPHTFIVTHQDH